MTRRVCLLLAALVLPLAAAGTGQEQQQPPPNVRQLLQLNQPPNGPGGFGGRAAPGLAQGRAGNRAPAGAVVHEPFTPPITAAKIRTAIDDAVLFLRGLQEPDGSVRDGYGGHIDGTTALTALTLLAAGADPAADDGLRRMLDWLAKQETNNTYVRGIRANVWEYALRKLPDDAQFRDLLKKEYDWLMKALGDREGWRYTLESRDWDNSCTQYGVLGVWAAARAGFDPGEKFWTTMSRHFRSCQNPDGGWGYVTSGSTPNMATAGLASLFLVFDQHHARTPYRKDNPRTFTEGDPAAVLASLDRGMTWLGQARGNKADGYYLYGIERTGVASGRRLIGGEDWFAEGALAVLQAQRRDGSIPLGSWGGPSISTSFCTLFLVYGGAPVAFNKLQYGAGQDWNLNPRDLANLSKSLWAAYERPINWQTVSLDAPVAQMEAPILFLSGSKRHDFTEKEALKLRDYVDRGGTILAEPSDASPEFVASVERLLADMYPPRDYPDVRLAPLPADHPIYTVVKQDWKARPRLRGASDGSRTFFLVSDDYLSADWQAGREDSDAFRLAMNLLFYATDLGELEGKFASILPDTAAAKAREGALTVARVQCSGTKEHPRDWEAAGRAWSMLAPLARHLTGKELKEAAPVDPGRDKLEGIHLLHLTGRSGLTLTDAEKQALKKYVEGGGTLLVDARAGSAAFARDARRELEALFGPLQPLAAADPVLAEGRFAGGADLATGVGYTLPARQALRARGESPEGQKLRVALVKNRPAVIWSEFDLACAAAGIPSYRAQAYKPESARKVLGNVLGFLTLE